MIEALIAVTLVIGVILLIRGIGGLTSAAKITDDDLITSIMRIIIGILMIVLGFLGFNDITANYVSVKELEEKQLIEYYLDDENKSQWRFIGDNKKESK